MKSNFLIFLTSIIFSGIIIFLQKKLFYKINLLDNPKKYWHKRKPIPHSMWVSLFFIFFVLSLIFIPFSTKLFLLWWFGLLITVVSFVDDFLFLSPKIRLFIQIIIWTIIWLTSIKVGYIENILWWFIDLSNYKINIFWNEIFYISTFFTMVWYVFIFNSLNWTDWITGNTAWISIISFLIMLFLATKLYFLDDTIALKDNSIFIIQISLILIWILIPFWFGNVREKYLMWDSGTMFLGFMLSSMSIIAGWKIATALIVFWIYSVDAVYVILKRIQAWKNPLNWDRRHLHYRLIDAWFTKTQTLVYIYLSSLFFGILSLFCDRNWKIIIFLFIIFFVILNPLLLLKNRKWKK